MLLNIFCDIDDFCKSFEKKWINDKILSKIKEAEEEFSTQNVQSGLSQQGPSPGKVR